MKKLLTVASAIIAISAQAKSEQLPDPVKMKKNVLYLLTENRAKVLDLDLNQIKREFSVMETEKVVVYLDQQYELNLSIFDEDAFNVMAMDIIK